MSEEQNPLSGLSHQEHGEVWPAVSYVEGMWFWRDASLSRAQKKKSRGAFRSAVVPKIGQRPVALSADIADLAADAEARVAQFDRESSQASMALAAILLRSESASSSQIEQLTASARRVSMATLGDTGSHNAVLIARNADAMKSAMTITGSITQDVILTMHERLMGGHDCVHAGRFRDELVWIGGISPVTASYVAPSPELVLPAITDLIEFIARRDISALAQAAITHAHFETIHPFTDGNGRTGRALVAAMMRHRGLNTNLSVPMSAGLLTNTETYFAALTAYRDGDINQIVERFALAAFQAIDNGSILREDLGTIRQAVLDVAQRKTPIYVRLVDAILTEIAFTAEGISVGYGIPLATVYRVFERWEDSGLLKTERKLGGVQVWSVPKVTKVLDEFAARAGRRTWA